MIDDLRRLADAKRADVLRRFFKTGPGDYGEGDVFLGLTVPQVREVARRRRDLPIADILRLGTSKFHEERLLALLLLVRRFQTEPEAAYRAYLSLFPHINNWDLVDASAEHVLGGRLDGRSLAPLRTWSASKNLWIRRMSLLATFYFIKRNRFGPTLDVARRLLTDPHDLIHKATGWMLREVGKRDKAVLVAFLERHHRRMSRTTLRYAIERFPAHERRAWLRR
ncbi:MAG TPA: DNA alkylation repair protein [Planctomycetota bacterium]